MNIGGATAMANRRRRTSTRPRAVPPDLGTPETRARLTPPPWVDWPTELQHAAIEMDCAVRVRVEQVRAKAQVIGRGAAGHDASDLLPPWEAHCYRRYRAWLELMERQGWLRHVPAICWFVVEAAPYPDMALLRAALSLWATGRVVGYPS